MKLFAFPAFVHVAADTEDVARKLAEQFAAEDSASGEASVGIDHGPAEVLDED